MPRLPHPRAGRNSGPARDGPVPARLDGLDVCRRLRSDPRTRSLPIRMLSVRQYPAERHAACEAGADGYLGKPFHAHDLRTRANALLTRSQHAGAAAPYLSPQPPKII
ncbi:response regulator [Actinoplanes sp. NPDC024001]|uniref:response regulator transcription factor n=1 Tax=Actinoplanes sp. NPDC024001 TaxID=3154598 RepID=UPI0033F47D12